MQIRPKASSRPCADASRERRILAEAFADALKWRDEWRAEIEGRAPEEAGPADHAKEGARARFAAAMARAELKRFHWDARREREFQRLKNGRYRGAVKA
jgi:hypothetical protein